MALGGANDDGCATGGRDRGDGLRLPALAGDSDVGFRLLLTSEGFAAGGEGERAAVRVPGWLVDAALQVGEPEWLASGGGDDVELLFATLGPV